MIVLYERRSAEPAAPMSPAAPCPADQWLSGSSSAEAGTPLWPSAPANVAPCFGVSRSARISSGVMKPSVDRDSDSTRPLSSTEGGAHAVEAAKTEQTNATMLRRIDMREPPMD